MRPAVSYIPYATSSHKQTGNIMTFEQSEERNLVENERNAEEDESIFSSIYELSTDYNSDEGSISTNPLKDIWDGRKIHPEINTRYARFNIRDRIKHT